MSHRLNERTLRAFGALIVRKRIEIGMTSLQLSERLKVSQSCLSRIENGSREVRLEMLTRLDEVLNISDNVVRFMKTGKF